MWRLGAALAADGKDAEALNSYIESYKTDKPDYAKYVIVEALYRKLNGSIDGLEAKIGQERVASTPAIEAIRPTSTPEQNADVPAAENASTEAPSVSGSPTPVATEPVLDQPKSSVEKIDEIPTPETSPADKVPSPKTEEASKTEPSSNESPAAANEDPKPLQEIKIAETKTEPAREPDPAPSQSEPTNTPLEKPATSSSKTTESKPLFEPIIIKIPNSRSSKASTAAKVEKVETEATDTKDGVTEKRTGDTVVTSGSSRPRLIDGQEVKLDEIPPCKVGASQENVSLINGGGTIGILISVDAPGDIKTLTAISSSPKDVELTLEPEIGGIPDRRFYVIKSISSAVGVYQVTFATTCGEKNVIVTVR